MSNVTKSDYLSTIMIIATTARSVCSLEVLPARLEALLRVPSVTGDGQDTDGQDTDACVWPFIAGSLGSSKQPHPRFCARILPPATRIGWLILLVRLTEPERRRYYLIESAGTN
jgi:hypothetical protein